MFILLEIDLMDNGFQTELIDISYVYYGQTRSSVPVANELTNSFTEK